MVLRCSAALSANGLELGLNLVPEVFVYDRLMRTWRDLIFVANEASLDVVGERCVDLSSAEGCAALGAAAAECSPLGAEALGLCHLSSCI